MLLPRYRIRLRQDGRRASSRNFPRFTVALTAAWLTTAGPWPTSPALAADTGFVGGYAAAILEREFGMPRDAISVEGTRLLVAVPELGEAERQRLRRALMGIPSVEEVTVLPAVPGAAIVPTTPSIASPAAPPAAPPTAPASAVAAVGPEILPRSSLFEPLMADPRWPRFSASYQFYLDDEDVTHAGAVSFGETFSLLRGRGAGGRWGVGFQAAVFALFDLDSTSSDLVNADYWVGIPLTYRRGDFSAQGRLYHQSSHIGDEFLIEGRLPPEERVNLSYEAADLLLSYDIGQPFRVYAGGTWRFNREPDDFGEWAVRGGMEYEAEDTMWGGRLRPVAAIDVRAREETDWDPDLSLRAGVRIENARIAGRSLLLLGEFNTGSNPNGQFYRRDLTYIGLGIQLELD